MNSQLFNYAEMPPMLGSSPREFNNSNYNHHHNHQLAASIMAQKHGLSHLVNYNQHLSNNHFVRHSANFDLFGMHQTPLAHHNSFTTSASNKLSSGKGYLDFMHSLAKSSSSAHNASGSYLSLLNSLLNHSVNNGSMLQALPPVNHVQQQQQQQRQTGLMPVSLANFSMAVKINPSLSSSSSSTSSCSSSSSSSSKTGKTRFDYSKLADECTKRSTQPSVKSLVKSQDVNDSASETNHRR